MIEKTSLKKINLEKIRSSMKVKSPSSKSELANSTNLSFPTVTRLLDELCSIGEVQATGQTESTGGRNADLYMLNPDYSMFLLIRMEGKSIYWIIKNLQAETIDCDSFEFTGSILERIDQLIVTLADKYPHLKAIVIGIAAMVSNGTIEETVLMEELKGIHLLLHFQNLTQIPVQLENDMNLLAYGQWYPCRERVHSSVCIYLGKCGFGAGIVLNGAVWKGHSSFAGELGYLPFLKDSNQILHAPERYDDVLSYYVKIIQLYIILFNPSLITLYNNPSIDGKIHEIRTLCNKLLPSHALAQIELSDHFAEDYEVGMFATAQQMIV